MAFKVGQRVVFLHEHGGGIIKNISENGRFIVEDDDGFERPYLASEIAPFHNNDYQLDEEDVSIMKEESEQAHVSYIDRKESKPHSRGTMDVWEIDLHIENIVDSHRHLTNAEIIKLQMNAFKLFYNKAMRKRIRKLVAIHGVGQGVLKHEVRAFLDDIDGVRYYDADFGEYGKGATTIEIHHFD